MTKRINRNICLKLTSINFRHKACSPSDQNSGHLGVGTICTRWRLMPFHLLTRGSFTDIPRSVHTLIAIFFCSVAGCQNVHLHKVQKVERRRFRLLHSDMVTIFLSYRSMVAHWYAICFVPGGPGFKSWQGR